MILTTKPSAHHFSTSRKFYDDIEFETKGFEKKFIIDNFEYKASLYSEITNVLNRGDAVKVWIDSSGKKGGYIRVYALEHKRISYINIRERNVIQSRYNKYGLIVALYGIFLLVNIYLRKG